jgi:hypothetical protein
MHLIEPRPVWLKLFERIREAPHDMQGQGWATSVQRGVARGRLAWKIMSAMVNFGHPAFDIKEVN